RERQDLRGVDRTSAEHYAPSANLCNVSGAVFDLDADRRACLEDDPPTQGARKNRQVRTMSSRGEVCRQTACALIADEVPRNGTDPRRALCVHSGAVRRAAGDAGLDECLDRRCPLLARCARDRNWTGFAVSGVATEVEVGLELNEVRERTLVAPRS